VAGAPSLPFRERSRGAGFLVAAEASEEAGVQGQFWGMHDLLFEYRIVLGTDDLCRYAELLRLDLARFEQEITGRAYAKRVEPDAAIGRRTGVSGTTTFCINGSVQINAPKSGIEGAGTLLDTSPFSLTETAALRNLIGR